ncbi:hypothetical protein [Spiroplasma endosymbiont of Cantharis lateralis]|uniref:hypothetical protein n=1 Tax=Spiroplasma endosymbiont of Cantharis lateralis TaxID=3066277 RepID=UPI00313CF8D6
MNKINFIIDTNLISNKEIRFLFSKDLEDTLLIPQLVDIEIKHKEKLNELSKYFFRTKYMQDSYNDKIAKNIFDKIYKSSNAKKSEIKSKDLLLVLDIFKQINLKSHNNIFVILTADKALYGFLEGIFENNPFVNIYEINSNFFQETDKNDLLNEIEKLRKLKIFSDNLEVSAFKDEDFHYYDSPCEIDSECVSCNYYMEKELYESQGQYDYKNLELYIKKYFELNKLNNYKIDENITYTINTIYKWVSNFQMVEGISNEKIYKCIIYVLTNLKIFIDKELLCSKNFITIVNESEDNYCVLENMDIEDFYFKIVSSKDELMENGILESILDVNNHYIKNN